MKTAPLYDLIRNCEEKTIVLQGGQWSGKTFSALQNIFTWSTEYPNLISTVVGEDIPALKKGALRDALRIVNTTPEIKNQVLNYNRSDRIFTFNNGSLIEFLSIADEQDAKGAKRNVLYVNEADFMKWEVYEQLAMRTNLEPFAKRIIDYNPTQTFWSHDKLIGKSDVRLFITDHRHNPFLTTSQHNEIESIEDTELWRVYARGLTGQLKASIYTNWVNLPIDQWPKGFSETIWAIDYGYGTSKTAGKTAIIKIGINKPRSLYIRECCYVLGGMDEWQIKQVLEKNGWQNGQPFYSEVDPAAIASLRRIGIDVNVAIKGERSEWYGINKIKQFTVYYTAMDENLQYEKNHYRWVAVGDIITNTVEDTRKWHLLAALRYGVYTHFFSLEQ
jgi:phage terminase large subunit